MQDPQDARNHEPVRLTEEQEKARRRRSLAIAWCLAFLVVVFFAVTYFKIGANIMNRPL